MLLDKDILKNRLATLQTEYNKTVSRVVVLEGQIAEAVHWLSEVTKAETTAKTTTTVTTSQETNTKRKKKAA